MRSIVKTEISLITLKSYCVILPIGTAMAIGFTKEYSHIWNVPFAADKTKQLKKIS